MVNLRIIEMVVVGKSIRSEIDSFSIEIVWLNLLLRVVARHGSFFHLFHL